MSSVHEGAQDVVQEIDKAITERVQKTLRQLRSDCAAIEAVIQHERQADAIKREANNTRRWNGTVLLASSAMVLLVLVVGLAARMAATARGGSAGDDMRSALNVLAGMLLAVVLGCAGGAAKLVRHQEPVLAQTQLTRLDEYAIALRKVAQQAEALHDDYLASLNVSRVSHEKKAV